MQILSRLRKNDNFNIVNAHSDGLAMDIECTRSYFNPTLLMSRFIFIIEQLSRGNQLDS